MIRKSFLTSSAMIALAANPALAQDQNGDTAAETNDSNVIIVTAQKRAENVQDIPIAVTALSADDVQNKRISNANDLDNLAPGLRVSSADAAANPKIFIRGVGLNDFNPTASAGVGIYADGVYVSSPLAQLAAFYDLERIEVLRGPQGTLYGRNTTSGAINAISRQPTQEFTANGSFEYGNFDAVAVNLGVGAPLVTDVAAFRIATQYISDDGFTTNRVTGRSVNNADRFGIKGSLLLTPTPDDEILISGGYFMNRGGATQAKQRALLPNTPGATGPDGFCLPAFYNTAQCADALGYSDTDSDPYSVESNIEAEDRVDSYNASLTYSHDFGDITLVSISAYQDVSRIALENTDAGPLQLIEATYNADQRTYSQELRLQGDTGNLQWVLGGFYFDDRIDNNSSFDVFRELRPVFTSPANPTGANFDPLLPVLVIGYPYVQKTEGYAIFGQVDYQITDSLLLTGGLRYSEDKKSIDYSRTLEGAIVQFTDRRSDTFGDFSGRLGLKYDINSDVNVYATYNRGYKSGGFFGGLADDISQLDPYENETVNAFEIGSKSTFWDRRAQLNLSAFFYDYKDIQVFSLVDRGGITVQVLDNAATAEIYGAEAELSLTPVDNLNLSASLAYLHAEYGDFTTLAGTFSGNRLPQAPRFSAQLGASYKLELNGFGSITPQVNANYRSKVFFDNAETERLSSDGLWIVDAQIAWTSESEIIEAGLWGKNLTDEANISFISNIESLGFDLLTYARPRTYGVFLRFNY